MKLARIVMFFNICLLGIMPVMSFAKPFVVLGADTEDVLDDVEVLDQATGLIWKHCPHGQFWNGADCGNSSFVVTHEEALDLAVAENAKDPGKKWRLPNIKELSSIVDRTQFDPSIDSSIFPGTRTFIPGDSFYSFWSSTPFVQDSSFAYGIFFQEGEVTKVGREGKGFVRLVRESDQYIK